MASDRDVLEINKELILCNLIPCEELYNGLANYKILPTSFINELMGMTDRLQKIDLIYDIIIKKDTKLEPLCDALLMSGHTFLADHLRYEKAMAEKKGHLLDKNDIAVYFNGLESVIPGKEEKKIILDFLFQKLKHYQAEVGWRESAVDKYNALHAKQQQIEEGFKLRDVLSSKDIEIARLEEQLNQATENADEKGIELKETASYLYEMKAKHGEEMNVQIQYNLANESSLQRLTKRLQEQEKVVHTMCLKMDTYLSEIARRTGVQSDEDLSLQRERERVLNYFDKARYYLNRVLNRAMYLDGIELRYEELCEETDYVLTRIGEKSGPNASLRTGMKGYIEDVNAEVSKLKDDNRRLIRDVEIFIDTQTELESKLNYYKRLSADAEALAKTVQDKNNRIAELEKLLEAMQSARKKQRMFLASDGTVGVAATGAANEWAVTHSTDDEGVDKAVLDRLQAIDQAGRILDKKSEQEKKYKKMSVVVDTYESPDDAPSGRKRSKSVEKKTVGRMMEARRLSKGPPKEESEKDSYAGSDTVTSELESPKFSLDKKEEYALKQDKTTSTMSQRQGNVAMAESRKEPSGKPSTDLSQSVALHADISNADKFLQNNQNILKNCLGGNYLDVMSNIQVQVVVKRDDGSTAETFVELQNTAAMDAFLRTGDVRGLDKATKDLLQSILHMTDKYVLQEIEQEVNFKESGERGAVERPSPAIQLTEEQYRELLLKHCLGESSGAMNRNDFVNYLRETVDFAHAEAMLEQYLEREKGMLQRHLGNDFMAVATNICFNVEMQAPDGSVVNEIIQLADNEMLRNFLNDGTLPTHIGNSKKQILNAMLKLIEKHALEAIYDKKHSTYYDIANIGQSITDKFPPIDIKFEEYSALLRSDMIKQVSRDDAVSRDFIRQLERMLDFDSISEFVETTFEPEVRVLRRHFDVKLDDIITKVVFLADVTRDKDVVSLGNMQLQNTAVLQTYLKTGRTYNLRVKTTLTFKHLVSVACKYILEVMKVKHNKADTNSAKSAVPIRIEMQPYKELLQHDTIKLIKDKSNFILLFDNKVLGDKIEETLIMYEMMLKEKSPKSTVLFKRFDKRYATLITKIPFKAQIDNRDGTIISEQLQLVDCDNLRSYLIWGHFPGMNAGVLSLLDKMSQLADVYVSQKLNELLQPLSETQSEVPIPVIQLTPGEYRRFVSLGLISVIRYSQGMNKSLTEFLQELYKSDTDPSATVSEKVWLQKFAKEFKAKTDEKLALHALNTKKLLPSEPKKKPGETEASSQRTQASRKVVDFETQEDVAPVWPPWHAKKSAPGESLARRTSLPKLHVTLDLIVKMHSGDISNELIRINNPLDIESLLTREDQETDEVLLRIINTLTLIPEGQNDRNKFLPVKLTANEYKKLKFLNCHGVFTLYPSSVFDNLEFEIDTAKDSKLHRPEVTKEQQHTRRSFALSRYRYGNKADSLDARGRQLVEDELKVQRSIDKPTKVMAGGISYEIANGRKGPTRKS